MIHEIGAAVWGDRGCCHTSGQTGNSLYCRLVGLRPIYLTCLLSLILFSCEEPSATLLSISEPAEFAAIVYPEGNPTTTEGLALGRDLFFDPILSQDGTVSCSTCHQPALAFSDGKNLSIGIEGRSGTRNAPGLANVGYLHETLFWDGRANDLESQALHPISAAAEMGGDWPSVITKLREHEDYWPRLQQAFGLGKPGELQKEHVGRALAQFQRSLISADSKYDRVTRGEDDFTEEEALGFALFFDFGDETEGEFANLPTAECAHCHNPPHFTNQRFFNNGLDEAFSLEDFNDPGRGAVSGSRYDLGLFKSPSLRNVALTGPYMHDGRMKTLAEVVAHYNQGGHYAENKSPNVTPLGLSLLQENALVAFLETLTDSAFVNNPDYRPLSR